MSKTRRRNAKGRYISKYDSNIRPLLWLMFGVFLLGMVWTYYQKHEEQKLLDPCDGCSFFMVRAYESGSDLTESLDDQVATTEALTEKEQIIQYIVEVFGEDAPDAFSVLYCENRNLNPNAVNYNRNGTRDLGIFQLNDQYWGGDENFNWKTNIDKAHKIFKNGGWSQWSCSTRVGIKPFYLK